MEGTEDELGSQTDLNLWRLLVVAVAEEGDGVLGAPDQDTTVD